MPGRKVKRSRGELNRYQTVGEGGLNAEPTCSATGKHGKVRIAGGRLGRSMVY